MSAEIPNFMARRCSDCEKKTLAKFATMVVSHRPGQSVTTSWNLTIPRPNIYIRYMETAVNVHRTRTPALFNKYPAVSHEQRIQHLSDDLERAGLKPFHVPLGIRIDEKNPRTSACIRCNTCDGHP